MPTLRDDLRFRLAGRLGAALARGLSATWHSRERDVTTGGGSDASRQIIAAFWHRHILSMCAHYRGRRVCVPVSRSEDGEYAAHIMARFGFSSVRGSSSRGGIGAVKDLMARAEEGYTLAITPDGPRGPRFTVQQGVALLARRSGLPVRPVGVAAERAWEFDSWDRFVMPKPFSRVAFVVGERLRYAEYEEVVAFCSELRNALFRATRRAREMLQESW